MPHSPPTSRSRTRWCSRSIALAFALGLLLPQLGAAQRIREWQGHGLATFAAQHFVGGGIGLGLRPPGRLGFFLGSSVGDLEGVLAGRVEGLAIFRLNPYATKGVHPYGGAGVAVLVRLDGAAADGYLTLLAGLELRPAGKLGWFVEGGVGGGVRLAAGIRVRRLTPAARR